MHSRVVASVVAEPWVAALVLGVVALACTAHGNDPPVREAAAPSSDDARSDDITAARLDIGDPPSPYDRMSVFDGAQRRLEPRPGPLPQVVTDEASGACDFNGFEVTAFGMPAIREDGQQVVHMGVDPPEDRDPDARSRTMYQPFGYRDGDVTWGNVTWPRLTWRSTAHAFPATGSIAFERFEPDWDRCDDRALRKRSRRAQSLLDAHRWRALVSLAANGDDALQIAVEHDELVFVTLDGERFQTISIGDWSRDLASFEVVGIWADAATGVAAIYFRDSPPADGELADWRSDLRFVRLDPRIGDRGVRIP